MEDVLSQIEEQLRRIYIIVHCMVGGLLANMLVAIMQTTNVLRNVLKELKKGKQ